MLNQSMPVASRTRGKREDGILKEYKKKKKREEEEKNKNHIRPIAEASTSGRHEGVHIIDLSDDTDDDDDFSTECSDDPKTSTSGEDNDDSEDLDFWEEEFDLMGAVDDDDDDDEEDEDEDEDDEKEIISVSEHNAGKSRQVYNSRGMSLGKKRLREDEDATIEPKRRGRKPKLKPSSSNKVKESADDEDDVDLPSIETKRRGRKPKLNSSNTVDEFDADDKDNVDLTPIEPKRRGRKPKLKPSSSNKVEESADDENDADLPSIETKRRGRKPKLNSSNTVDESDADDKDDVDLTRIEPKRRGRKPKLNSSNKVDEYAADDEGYVGLTPKVKLSSSINVDDSTSEDDTVDLTHEIDIEPTSSGRKPKKHRRRKPEVKPSSSKKVDLVEVLAYSIWDKEDSDSALDETLKQENNLPVGVVDKMSHEKADSDEDDMGNLWAEMQFCLASSEIGSTRPSLYKAKSSVDRFPSDQKDSQKVFGPFNPHKSDLNVDMVKDDGEKDACSNFTSPGVSIETKNAVNVKIPKIGSKDEFLTSDNIGELHSAACGFNKEDLLKVFDEHTLDQHPNGFDAQVPSSKGGVSGCDYSLDNPYIDKLDLVPVANPICLDKFNNFSILSRLQVPDFLTLSSLCNRLQASLMLPSSNSSREYVPNPMLITLEDDSSSHFIDPTDMGDSLVVAKVENKEVDFSNVRRDRAFLCQHGNHQLILDEEIGMKCRYCSYVELEIRYIVPPFLTGSSRRHERRDSALGSFSMFEGLQCEESNCDMPSNDPSVDIQGTVWEIIPDLRRKLYSHQREGFQFIWNNIAGGIYRDPEKNPYNNDIGGCIVSHAPGTGKTLLTIVFLYTYMKVYPASRPVIVAPKSMLLTWEAEFRKWSVDIPFHNLNDPDFSGKEKAATIGLYEKGKQGVSDGPLARRLVKLLSWKCDGGILGISYTLFEKLAGTESKGKRKCTPVDELVSNALLKLPGLFVFDEGHIPRNDDTLLWKALSKIKTERRIILSGTPFQNNFDELFNTLCLVRPKFAEGIQSGHQRVVNKTRDGKFTDAKRKWTSMTDCIGKVGDGNEAEKLKELRAKMAPFVHVHKGTILQSSLPGLRHSVVVLQPSDLQKKILDRLKQTQKFFALDYYEALVSIHPSVLQQSEIKKDKEIVSPIVRSIVSMDDLERIRLKPDEGVKTKFLKELIRLSLALNEKVIVFSQFLEPLNLIMDQLRLFFNWKEGEEILYMDGKCHIKQRQSSINAFNDPTSKARVLLASTKACSEGINLIGGSRVVLLDVTWNPSVERQALSRAYRLGQKKVVYTYNLISSGTMDVSKCQRQAGKDRISNLVFSAANKDGYDQEKPFEVLQDSLLEEMVQHKSLKSMFKRIINQPKDSDLIATFGDLSEPTGI
ncbi:SNF2-related protein [Corchorus olitorius]|uniref:SNF2-related protein n=1 Tax=Corchorus olitorius TaxID=93759 RepID=A0A1R3I4K0_9ROSI|nr:SNF2-related protein [Corchorus olitorius]